MNSVLNYEESLGLKKQVNEKLDLMITKFYQYVPHGKYQRDAHEIDIDYYKRHSIETILRIKHKRMIDALVVHYFTKHDPRQAKAWAHYIEDEMLHGHMFAKDLERLFNLSITDIYQYEPLLATQLLNGYFYFTLEHEGPMASIASAYFLEYVTRKTQPDWLDNLEKILGKENLKGARAHVNHDIEDNHNDFVWDVLISTLHNKADVIRLNQHLENIFGLFSAYFVEVYQKTIGEKMGDAIYSIPVEIIKYSSVHSK